MRVVLDTNILISACLKPDGLEAQVVARALSGAIVVCVSQEILSEYEDVFARAKFAALLARSEPLLAALKQCALLTHPTAAVHAAVDPDDNRFLECAHAAQAALLITGNLRHFPPSFGGTNVVNARQFLAQTPEELTV